MPPRKPRAKNAFEWFFSHADIITTTDYFLHNAGEVITIEDIDKVYGFSDFYQKNNLLKHLLKCNVISKTKGGYKLKKTSTTVKALKILKQNLQNTIGDR